MTNNHLLLYRLAELMLEKQQHILPLDDLFEDEQIGAFVRSIQIDSPYQQLIFEGVLTETIKEERVMVTFTVEGYFHYVLGEVIEKQTLGKEAEELKNLLEKNKLRGITEGVEQCLVRDVEKNDLSRLMWLIDEGGKALEASAYPLAQAFLMIDHKIVLSYLLEKPTENDLVVILKAIYNLEIALDIILKNHGNIHPLTARNYSNIGSAYLRKREYRTAHDFFNKALSIDKQIFHEYHHNLGLNFDDIGDVYFEEGYKVKAREYYEKSKFIFEYNYGADFPHVKLLQDKILTTNDQ